MTKTKIVHKSTELLIGLFTLILLSVLYWGVSFLKGENLFSNKRYFYAIYENVNGLTISRPVTVNGFRVGQVSNISFSTEEIGHLIVEVAIEENIDFSKKAILEIYDSDIMGSKSLELKMIPDHDLAINGDTLLGSIATGLTSEVSEQFGSVKVGLDQLIISFDKVLKEVQVLSNTTNRILLSNEERFSNSVQSIENIASTIDAQTKNINNIISNISSFSHELDSLNISSLFDQTNSITNELELLLININEGGGSLGKLLNQDSIYNELSHTLTSLNALINDIKNDPKKYVNISLWGNDKKKPK